MIPLEYLEKVDRALLRAAAKCDAPLPLDTAAKAETQRRIHVVSTHVSCWRM